MIRLENYSENYLQQIVDLHNLLSPKNKHWNLSRARAQLTDISRAHGQNVVLAFEGDKLCGVAGWVSRQSEFYGAPLFAESQDVYQILVEHLLPLARSENSRFVRIGANATENNLFETLNEKTFEKIFDFLEMEIETDSVRDLSERSEDFELIPSSQVDPKKYMSLYNMSFAEVSNAPAVNLAQAEEIWSDADLIRDLSFVLREKNGDYAGFVLVQDDGHIDSIGIDPVHQRKGLGKKMYNEMIGRAHKYGIPRLHCTIASNNFSSLEFHKQFGFRETSRRGIWELKLS